MPIFLFVLYSVITNVFFAGGERRRVQCRVMVDAFVTLEKFHTVIMGVNTRGASLTK
jgi:hypothetical protein